MAIVREAHGAAARESAMRRAARRVRFPGTRLLWSVAGVVVFFVLASLVAALFVDEPLRRYMEREMNASLEGYTVSIRRLDFHPLGLSIDLEDWTLSQQAHPQPPVADFPRLTASVQWRALLDGRLVAEFHFDRPRIHVNRRHLAAEASDEVPVSDRGWQQALEAVYPLEINELTIADGEITYVDDDPKRPLTIENLDFRAENIRNVRSRDRTYPSELHLTGTIFDSGTLELDGNADFLAEPYAGVKADLAIAGMKLDYFAPVVDEYNVSITKGTLSAQGSVEYSPAVKTAELREVDLENLAVQYANRPSHDAAVKRAVAKTKEAAADVSNQPGVLLKIDHLEVDDGTFAFVDEARDPHYELFVADTDATVTNVSNQRTHGTATAKLTGKFMGSGITEATATFRPDQKRPDFDLKLDIRDTDLRSLNDLLRAYGKFDVASGSFGLTTEISIENDRAHGYVKPFFRDMNVYDARQDADENLLHKMYEGVVGGVAGLLENERRDEVATKTDISGPASSPQTSTVQIIVNLIRNAFFQAILPGFDAAVRKPGGG